MLALIDGDIVAYRVGWTTENDEEWIARARCQEMLDGILIDTGADEFIIYLSDSAENNFRYKIYPQYKANRQLQPRPKHLGFIKEHLFKEWGAQLAIGQEADDALGIEQCRIGKMEMGVDSDVNSNLSIICSIDKDLKQIPGQHYNFVKKEYSLVTPDEGLKYFYKQILTGDTADNISGAPGIGPVRVGRIIDPLAANPGTLAEAVFKAFLKQLRVSNVAGAEEVRLYIEKIGQVLKIRQEKEEQLWHFPVEKQMVEHLLLSTLKKPGEAGQSTEPTTPPKDAGFPLLGEKQEVCLTEKQPS